MCDKKMNRREFYISEKQYMQLEFMNEVPEIVCDILYHLSGYVHHRTNKFSYEAYEEMLRCQHDKVVERSA